MFNFDTAEDVTKIKRFQTSHIVVMASGRVRLNAEAIELLSAEGKNIHVLADKEGNVVISAIAINEENPVGKPLNKEGGFTNQNLAKTLGGQFSEWNIEAIPIKNPLTGDTYYPLTELVNGAEKRAELATAAGENTDADESTDQPAEASMEADSVEDPTDTMSDAVYSE